jgi:hypothetical protein
MEIQSTQEPVKIVAKQRSAVYLHENPIRQLPSNDPDLESQKLAHSSDVDPISSQTKQPAPDPQVSKLIQFYFSQFKKIRE